MSAADGNDFRVLICAPVGRDSVLTVELLQRASIPSVACASIAEVCDCLVEGAGAVLLTEEALGDRHIGDLAAALATQPAWSDISLLLFAGGDRNEASLRTLQTLEVLRNVTLLERPVRTAAVISTVRAALRGRARQYELRDVLTALHRARGEAEHASRLKDEFLATVSHELRTPLNAIMGWVSLLRQGRFTPERAAAALEIVERNAKSQAQLIADILDVSRMITGQVKLNVALVPLARVITDAVETIKPGADSRRIEIRLDIDDATVVAGDRERLQQVCWNVLSNACKFTREGGRITVTQRNDGAWATLRVSDTGAGISPEFLPFVFDRFRQADQTFTRSHGGLGLGLAIVKHLVEMHGGEVRAESEGAGKGATIEIRLPLAGTTSAARPGQPLGPLEKDWLPDMDFTGRLVLLVDDDDETRVLMRAILERTGARVAVAESARRATDLLDAEVPSLIIADLGMPDEDGLSMMRRIRDRSEAEGSRVPAIALSAYARAEDRQAALDAGFDEFLTKPAMPSQILRAIDRALTAPSRAR